MLPRDLAMDVALRPALPADRFMIRRWLAEPEIAAWWGGRDSAEATIAVAVDNALALARIILCDGAPVGYAHALDGMLAGLPEREECVAGNRRTDRARL